MASETDSSESNIHRIAVVGAGTMGHGIALTFALGGKNVVLYDIDEEALESAEQSITESIQTVRSHESTSTGAVEDILARISYESSLEAAVSQADLVTEAVAEDMGVKKSVVSEIEMYAPDSAILASNTSGLSITELSTAVEEPSAVVGTHYFNPPYIVPVVELVKGEKTDDSIVDQLYTLFESIDKTPVIVERDIPGFIVNRIQTAMAYEAESLVNRGIASAEDIDRAIKGSLGFRLPILGIFEKSDHSGLDIHHDVISHLLPELDRGTEPHDFLTKLANEGEYGVKTGSGIYNWEDRDRDAVFAERDKQLLSQLALYHSRVPVQSD